MPRIGEDSNHWNLDFAKQLKPKWQESRLRKPQHSHIPQLLWIAVSWVSHQPSQNSECLWIPLTFTLAYCQPEQLWCVFLHSPISKVPHWKLWFSLWLLSCKPNLKIKQRQLFHVGSREENLRMILQLTYFCPVTINCNCMQTLRHWRHVSFRVPYIFTVRVYSEKVVHVLSQ